jgi:hypothetical protein
MTTIRFPAPLPRGGVAASELGSPNNLRDTMITSAGSNYLTALYATQQAASVSSLASTSGSSSVGGTGSLTGDRANISGPGKLLGQLLALQSSDPAKFKQVAADIASALQIAAATQPTDTTANQFLTDLANQFQTVSTTGDLSALLPPKHGHHHLHPQGTYNQLGQAAPVLADPTATSGTDLTQLFQNLITQVSQATAA